MTELVEPVYVANMGHEKHDKETCAFCEAPTEPTDETNVLAADFDQDVYEVPGLMDDGVPLKNSSGKLGKNLIHEEKGNTPQVTAEVSISGYDQLLPVNSSAHHVIPGNAALKVSKIMKYLHKDGTATGNIGYDVNNHENGIWLVGNYALRGKNGLPSWGPEGAKFLTKTKKDPYEYAKLAIAQSKCQFHDGHGKYSEYIKDALDLVAKKMKLTGDVWCIEDDKKKDKDPEDQQLYMLVNRLNTISRRTKTMLEEPGKNWKKNVYTSRFSEKYIKEQIY